MSIQDLREQIRLNDAGLIPVVVQDTVTKRVLMLAWMNIEAIERTVSEGRVTYWSRSRHEFWRKGDTSGHTQIPVSLSVDCDGDSLLLEVHQQGSACHTGTVSCFDTMNVKVL